MKKRIYIETTIPGYLTSRPSRDLIQAARQQLTHEWWAERRLEFLLFTSQLVIDEASEGNPEASERRLAVLQGLPLIQINEDAIGLARRLCTEGILPEKAATDALHIGVATAHQMDFLLTWNCAHLANAEILGEVARIMWSAGWKPPVICTPEELMGD